jgi:alkylation response protein AidB-like acyl-CoA dehydrogenase
MTMREIYVDQDAGAMREAVRKLAADKLAPIATACDADDRFPGEIKQHLADAGLLILPVPAEHGGLGASTQTLSLVLEEVAYAFATLGPVLLSTYSPIVIVAAAGTEAQKAAFFGAITAKPSLGAFCLSEPHCGSDARAMKTRAVRHGTGWVINGRKRWITNGGIADFYLLFCRTGDGRDDISTFVVPANTPGLSFGRQERKMGLRGGPLCDVVFDDVEVGEHQLVGSVGQGWKILERIANTMRCWGAGSIALGIARAACDIAARYANERSAFGQQIGRFEGVGFKLADMAMRLRTAQLLVRDTNWRVDEEFPAVTDETVTQVSMAKCHAADVAMANALESVQILGGYGYMQDYTVERLMRDAKAFQILDGSNEIQRLIIARHVLRNAR